MKRLNTLAVSAAVMVIGSSTAFGAANFGLSNLKPYVGIDVMHRAMGYEDKGEAVFKKNPTQGNIYAGLKFHRNFGVEVGYEHTGNRGGDVVGLENNQPFLGDDLDEDEAYTGKARIKGYHVNLVGLIPMSDLSHCFNECLELFGSIGVARLKLQPELTRTDDGMGAVNVPLCFSTKTKSVLRLTGGLKYRLYKCLGIRGLVGWENTSRLRASTNEANPVVGFLNQTFTVRAKNSVFYGIGAFLEF